jgi:catalase (peroxidase I)
LPEKEKQVRIAPGNEKETMFMEDLPLHFDPLQTEILANLDKAQDEFESIYPTFY